MDTERIKNSLSDVEIKTYIWDNFRIKIKCIEKFRMSFIYTGEFDEILDCYLDLSGNSVSCFVSEMKYDRDFDDLINISDSYVDNYIGTTVMGFLDNIIPYSLQDLCKNFYKNSV